MPREVPTASVPGTSAHTISNHFQSSLSSSICRLATVTESFRVVIPSIPSATPNYDASPRHASAPRRHEVASTRLGTRRRRLRRCRDVSSDLGMWVNTSERLDGAVRRWRPGYAARPRPAPAVEYGRSMQRRRDYGRALDGLPRGGTAGS